MAVKFDTADIIRTVRAAGYAVPRDVLVSWSSTEIKVLAIHATTLVAVHTATQIAKTLDDAGYVIEDPYGTTYVMVTGLKADLEGGE